MSILHIVAWFGAGGLLINTLPHLIAGLQGRAFQSPFAKPPGVGLSSPLSNVLWGFFNLVASWALFTQVGAFDLANAAHAGVAAFGGLFSGVFLAVHFGKLHGSGKGY
ncbi:MAG: hypothetical protein P8J20_01250 [Novosphingobium sp.]|nr:hypothetical protein [Novosphingobium sp.]